MVTIDIDKLISWGRYLYWSDILRCRFNDYKKKDSSSSDWHFYALMSQWYASVWVVVEGWHELNLKDDVVDRLLNGWADYCKLLKQYRHCVYHYQKNIMDKRFIDLLQKGDEHVLWISVLHDEFQRFFWEWPQKITNLKEYQEEIRETIKESIGWIPTEIFPARKHNLEKLAQEAEKLLSNHSDYESPAARELLEAISYVKKLADEMPKNPLLNMLDKSRFERVV